MAPEFLRGSRNSQPHGQCEEQDAETQHGVGEIVRAILTAHAGAFRPMKRN